MNIRGLQRFSLVDYPGKLACIVFVGECNFRCPYCHNPCLVFDPESQPLITETEFFDFLSKRTGKLDGVVISGGEPSLRNALEDFASKIKEMGFFIKLDTNGSTPDRVIEMHRKGYIDAFGIDYKAPTELYNLISRNNAVNLAAKVRKLIKYAIDNNIPTDIRTTVHKSLLSEEHLREMRVELDTLGVRQWTLQQFHPVDIIDDNLLEQETYSDRDLLNISRSLGSDTKVRGLTGIHIH
jgi:pyruvate formate lyase activating enzyme